jgi:hypothetical protein
MVPYDLQSQVEIGLPPTNQLGLCVRSGYVEIEGEGRGGEGEPWTLMGPALSERLDSPGNPWPP